MGRPDAGAGGDRRRAAGAAAHRRARRRDGHEHIALLRAEVLEANLELVRHGLVVHTFGNASAIDRDTGLVVIKPSGVPYDELTPRRLVVTDLDGPRRRGAVPAVVRPADAPGALPGVPADRRRRAHALAVRHGLGAGRAARVPCLGTTHADYFRGAIPVTDAMTADEIQSAYEWNTGQVIVRRFADLDPLEVAGRARPRARARSAGRSRRGRPPTSRSSSRRWRAWPGTRWRSTRTRRRSPPALRDKHFLRKHGPGAYYGQGTGHASRQ